MVPHHAGGLILGLAALPLAGRSAIAAPSDLARACEWAIGHRAWICDASLSDEAVEVESDRHEDVIRRAIAEPSKVLGDLSAKARLILDDLSGNELFDSPYNDDRLIVVVLREAASLCA